MEMASLMKRRKHIHPIPWIPSRWPIPALIVRYFAPLAVFENQPFGRTVGRFTTSDTGQSAQYSLKSGSGDSVMHIFMYCLMAP